MVLRFWHQSVDDVKSRLLFHVQKLYNFGGLGKCMEDGAAARLQESLLVRQDAGDSRFKLANDRFRVLIADAPDIS